MTDDPLIDPIRLGPRRDTLTALAALLADQEPVDDLFLSVLDELDLPTTMPGDTLYTTPPRTPGDKPGAMFFDVNGHPLPGDTRDQCLAWEALRQQDDNMLKTSLWFHGTPILVSTSYLGVNYNIFPGVPIIWETMIQSTFRWTTWQMRYCTKAAATESHRIIVECLVQLGVAPDEAP